MVELDIPLTEEETAEREARVLYWRTRSALRDAPELALHVRTIAINGRAERGETLREWSAPMMITAADSVDEFFAQLVEWRLYWYRWLEPVRRAVVVTPWTNDAGEAQGFAANTSPGMAEILTRNQTKWLTERIDQISAHPSGKTFQEDVTSLVWALRSKYPLDGRAPKPVSSRPCPVCGLFTVGADWFVPDEPSSALVKCQSCGFVIPIVRMKSGATDEWLPRTERVDDPQVVSEERARLLAKLYHRPSEAATLLNISKSTMTRMIRFEGLPTYRIKASKYRHVILGEVREWVKERATRAE